MRTKFPCSLLVLCLTINSIPSFGLDVKEDVSVVKGTVKRIKELGVSKQEIEDTFVKYGCNPYVAEDVSYTPFYKNEGRGMVKVDKLPLRSLPKVERLDDPATSCMANLIRKTKMAELQQQLQETQAPKSLKQINSAVTDTIFERPYQFKKRPSSSTKKKQKEHNINTPPECAKFERIQNEIASGQIDKEGYAAFKLQFLNIKDEHERSNMGKRLLKSAKKVGLEVLEFIVGEEIAGVFDGREERRQKELAEKNARIAELERENDELHSEIVNRNMEDLRDNIEELDKRIDTLNEVLDNTKKQEERLGKGSKTQTKTPEDDVIRDPFDRDTGADQNFGQEGRTQDLEEDFERFKHEIAEKKKLACREVDLERENRQESQQNTCNISALNAALEDLSPVAGDCRSGSHNKDSSIACEQAEADYKKKLNEELDEDIRSVENHPEYKTCMRANGNMDFKCDEIKERLYAEKGITPDILIDKVPEYATKMAIKSMEQYGDKVERVRELMAQGEFSPTQFEDEIRKLSSPSKRIEIKNGKVYMDGNEFNGTNFNELIETYEEDKQARDCEMGIDSPDFNIDRMRIKKPPFHNYNWD